MPGNDNYDAKEIAFHDRATKIWHGIKDKNTPSFTTSSTLKYSIIAAAIVAIVAFSGDIIIGSNSGIIANNVALPEHGDKMIARTPFYKKKVVFSGRLKWGKRREAEAQMTMLGADVMGDVTSQTDYLIIGTRPGSKLDRAKKYGTKVLTEKEWLLAIN